MEQKRVLILIVLGAILLAAIATYGITQLFYTDTPSTPAYMTQAQTNLSTEDQVRKAHVRLLNAFLQHEPDQFWNTLMAHNYTLLLETNNFTWQEDGVSWIKEHDRPYSGKYTAREVISLHHIDVYNATNVPARLRVPYLRPYYDMQANEYLAVALTKCTDSGLRKVSEEHWVQVYRKVNGSWIAQAGRFI